MGGMRTDNGRPRLLRIGVNGHAPLRRIVVVRNGDEAKTHACRGAWDAELEWQDDASLDALWLPSTKFSPAPFCFYYVRAEQADGGKGWTSPIWIVQR